MHSIWEPITVEYIVEVVYLSIYVGNDIIWYELEYSVSFAQYTLLFIDSFKLQIKDFYVKPRY